MKIEILYSSKQLAIKITFYTESIILIHKEGKRIQLSEILIIS